MRMQLMVTEKTWNPTAEFEHLLRKAFDLYQRELGLTQWDSVVQVSFLPLPPRTGGATDSQKRDPYSVTMTIIGVHATLFNLGHELTHVAQMARGDLRADVEHELTYWKGEAYEKPDAFAVDTPPEKEAYETAPKLWRKLTEELSREEMLFVLQHEELSTAGEVFSNFKVMAEKWEREYKELKRLNDLLEKFARENGDDIGIMRFRH